MKNKYHSEVLGVEKENDTLKEKIENLKKIIVSKDERIVQLELDNSTYENRIRIIESSLEDTKRKADDLTEKYAIEKSEHDELKEQYNIEEIKVAKMKVEAERILSQKDIKQRNTREVVSNEQGSSYEEIKSPVLKAINNITVKVNNDSCCNYSVNPEIHKKPLRLIDSLMADINSRLAQLSTSRKQLVQFTANMNHVVAA